MRNSDSPTKRSVETFYISTLHCLCDPGYLLQTCVKTTTAKFHYLQILHPLPLLPDSNTCKFHVIQLPLCSSTCKFHLVTFTANCRYLQIPPPLLSNSITCKFSAPDRLDKTPACDGWTDGQTDRQPVIIQRMHCEQCGRAVKIIHLQYALK